MWLSAPVTVVWLVGMQVSVNLLDGADGVAAGVIAIVAGVCLLAAINRLGATPGRVQNGVVILSGARDGMLPRIPRLQPPAGARLHGRLRAATSSGSPWR